VAYLLVNSGLSCFEHCTDFQQKKNFSFGFALKINARQKQTIYTLQTKLLDNRAGQIRVFHYFR